MQHLVFYTLSTYINFSPFYPYNFVLCSVLLTVKLFEVPFILFFIHFSTRFYTVNYYFFFVFTQVALVVGRTSVQRGEAVEIANFSQFPPPFSMHASLIFLLKCFHIFLRRLKSFFLRRLNIFFWAILKVVQLSRPLGALNRNSKKTDICWF